MNEEMFDAACEFYGSCIGSKYCLNMTVEFMMSEYKMSAEEANEYAVAAFKEWVSAYE